MNDIRASVSKKYLILVTNPRISNHMTPAKQAKTGRLKFPAHWAGKL